MSDDSFDLICVGAGLAGLAAACRVHELGGRALVLEASDDPDHLCASRVNGGIFHVAFRSVMADPAQLSQAVIDATDGFVLQELAQAMAANAHRAVEWLQHAGVEFTRIDPDEGWKDFVLAPLGFYDTPGISWKGLGGDCMLHRLEQRLLAMGGILVRGARATSLLAREGTCTGVVASSASGDLVYAARGVLLADGGFHADAEMLRRFVTPHPERLKLRSPPSGCGDGIRMAERMGAKLVGMESFYGHLLSADSLHNDALSPFPFLDFLATAGFIVDGSCERFVDEGRGAHAIANAVARHGDGVATVIFDDAMWNTAGREFICPPNPRLIDCGGTLHIANTLDELAVRAGLPGNALARAVVAHNAAIADDHLDRLTPPRTVRNIRPQPFATPPYYAAPVCAAITHTMGGVAIDAHARVLDGHDRPIRGVYAAGATCGGLEGGPDAAYLGGLLPAAAFGLIAAETIMAFC